MWLAKNKKKCKLRLFLKNVWPTFSINIVSITSSMTMTYNKNIINKHNSLIVSLSNLL